MLEMGWVELPRPGGTAYKAIADAELQEIATAMRWVCTLGDIGEGPHASWNIFLCDKRTPSVCLIGSLKMGVLSFLLA